MSKTVTLILFITGTVVIHVGPRYMYVVLDTNTTLLQASMFSQAHALHLGQKSRIPTRNHQLPTCNEMQRESVRYVTFFNSQSAHTNINCY